MIHLHEAEKKEDGMLNEIQHSESTTVSGVRSQVSGLSVKLCPIISAYTCESCESRQH